MPGAIGKMAGNEVANEEVGNEAGQDAKRAWAATAVRRGLIPFAVGIMAAHLLVAPIAAVPTFLAVAGVVLFAERTRWLCGLAIGVAWGTVFVQAAIAQPISFFASVAVHQTMQPGLGEEDCGDTLTLVGTVTGLPRVEDKVVRFEFDARLAAPRCSLASNDSPDKIDLLIQVHFCPPVEGLRWVARLSSQAAIDCNRFTLL